MRGRTTRTRCTAGGSTAQALPGSALFHAQAMPALVKGDGRVHAVFKGHLQARGSTRKYARSGCLTRLPPQPSLHADAPSLPVHYACLVLCVAAWDGGAGGVRRTGTFVTASPRLLPRAPEATHGPHRRLGKRISRGHRIHRGCKQRGHRNPAQPVQQKQLCQARFSQGAPHQAPPAQTRRAKRVNSEGAAPRPPWQTRARPGRPVLICSWVGPIPWAWQQPR